MNKKIFLAAAFGGLLMTSVSFPRSLRSASGSGTVDFDIHVIEALSHANGETVNFVNDGIRAYWDNDPLDTETLKELYEYNTDIASFADHSYDPAYVRDLYAQWDDFRPVNNTLTWKSNVRATSYDITVSLDAAMTEVLYEEKGLTKEEYTMENPYSGTHYFWQVTAHTDEGDVKSTIFDFRSGDYKRTLDIPGVSNTRDVGGFQGEFGFMKEGLIYRTARFDDIGEEGKASLARLNVETDLDLRSKGEGEANPAGLHKYALRTMKSYANDFRDENRAATIEAVRVFADPENYPIAFHCAVGRDRTGTLAMLLQALAGASRDYIIHDYYTSMWSVTGALAKTTSGLNADVVKETLDLITQNGTYSLAEGAHEFLREKEDNEGNKVGLSEAEIQSIRDIWSGKTEAPHALVTHKAEDNYEGMAFVRVKAVGHEDIAMMVPKGTILSAPYDLEEGFGWYVSGSRFDFSSPITDTLFIYADHVSAFVITIRFSGISREDEIFSATMGEVIDLSQYETDGYSMLALSDTGKEISRLEVTRDASVNILYYAI